jgi:hypothetical protein
VLGLTLSSAWLLSRMTEARTDDVRHLAYRVLDLARRREADAVAIAEEAAIKPESLPVGAV